MLEIVGCVLRTIGPAARGGAWYASYRTSVALAGFVILVLAAGLSCPSRTATLAPGPSQSLGDEDFVIFVTGNESGSLRPCGCSGGQLGGIEKRSAVFNTVPASRRLVVATGRLVRQDGEQDLIKYRILFEAFKLLAYDVVVGGADRHC